MSKSILFLQGGWEGHAPEKIVPLFSRALEAEGFRCETITSLEPLADTAWLRTFDVIFPCWTMGKLRPEQSKGLHDAVHAGTGLAGVHGGMGDAFRGDLAYEWMVGGHFVGHPHVGEYTVRVKALGHPIMEGLPWEFPYRSEQYYMLIDPAVSVLADADYTHESHACVMPVAWTKSWGAGRVFYSALGHQPSEFTDHPAVFAMSVRGVRWAARDL